MNRLDPASFGSIIDDIEYQKSYLFHIHLPDITLSDSVGGMGYKKLSPSDSFELCTSSTAFPVMQSQVMSIAYYNSELKIPTKTTYSNWGATFKLDLNNMAATTGTTLSIPLGFMGTTISIPNIPMNPANSYQYFYSWQQASFDPNSRVSFLPCNYKQSIDLILLNELGEEITGFTLEGAFPIGISGGNLDYGSDSILTFTVDFAFDRFTTTKWNMNK